MFEPLVLVAAVVDHYVHDEFDAAVVHAFQHPIEIFHGAELFHDGPIVADVVAVIVVRRAVYRVQPHHIHAQALDVVQLFDDPFEVANAIPVGVFETAGVDLVNDGLFPPGVVGFGAWFRGFGLVVAAEED